MSLARGRVNWKYPFMWLSYVSETVDDEESIADNIAEK